MQNPPSKTVAIERKDANSKTAHQQLIKKARSGGIDLYFLGDSITRRWGCADAQWKHLYANWKEHFWGWNAANFGWGADTLQNILWRIQNGELDGVSPKIFVILGGTNDLPGLKTNPQAATIICDRMAAILQTVHEKAPQAKVILTAIFPRDDDPDLEALIPMVNAELKTLAIKSKATWLDINQYMLGEDRNLKPGITVDGLHLSPTGYDLWATGLKPLLIKHLGKPSKTDHAPAPTSDPSAKPGSKS